MDKELLDLYTDYLISSFGLATATGLSSLVGNAVSHAKITRLLSGRDFTSADLWLSVKPLVRSVQSEEMEIARSSSNVRYPANGKMRVRIPARRI